jgi:predicted DNA-binding protein (UPF0251 family)
LAYANNGGEMPRPFKNRWIYGSFEEDYFKPRGRRMSELKEVQLRADELEALRLADLEGFYQNDAADKMGVSRQTFGNILKRAHQKVADALINGKAIRMNSAVPGRFRCRRCGHGWGQTVPESKNTECPECSHDSYNDSKENKIE